MEGPIVKLALLEEIEHEMALMTEAHVRRAERNLCRPHEGERALGTIHSEGARRAWALANAYEARGMEAALGAKFRADSLEERDALKTEATRCAAVEEIVRDLFWLQVKVDIGGEAWTSAGGIGLRSGWMLVASAPHPVEGLIAKLLGGGA